MHPTFLRPIAPLTLVVALAWAMPLAAQQPPAPMRAPQKTAQRAPARAGAPSPAPRSAPSGRAPYGARQAGAAEPAAQPARGAAAPGQAPGAVVRNAAPQAPFNLTPTEQQLLDQILIKWEQQSNRVKTFKCEFERWEVNLAFGPKEYNYVLSDGKGYIKYKSPDHGIYRVSEQKEWNDQKKIYEPRTTGLDHWVCTGKSIFEFNAQKRQLIERELAPQMQGKAITEGPLPFIFGAKADQLKRRYWMRDITQGGDVNKQVWLEAWPKFQQDAANFQHAIVILNTTNFMPEALRIILPDGKNKQDYTFANTQLNDPLSILKLDFTPPIKPLGWTYVFEAAQQPQQIAPPAAAGPTADRTPPEKRK